MAVFITYSTFQIALVHGIVGVGHQADKSEFIKENIDETVFMFALFKCRKSDKGRN